MNPGVRGDLPLIRKPDHVHRGRVSGRLARAAFERRFQLPDRRIARPADRVEPQAGARFAAMAHHLQPAISAIEALRDRRRRLGRAANEGQRELTMMRWGMPNPPQFSGISRRISRVPDRALAVVG